jgi:D-alanyl-D-alanine carboxypeptidase/D-alanyl-D-alanine-endopeptidase (penicillin-binding protein 4)
LNEKNIVLKKIFLLILFFNVLAFLQAQDIKNELNSAYKKFTSDNNYKHASISLLVINNSTGKVITDINSQTGLAPASCLKVITAATSFELLGHSYSYKTSLGYTGKIINGVLNGDIIIKGSGDPTLGSWRYTQTTEDTIITEFKNAISREGIHEITGHVNVDETSWKGEVTPEGWIWEDIGNYYGAGARALNWRENQYDLILKSGKAIGDSVEFVSTIPAYIENFNCKILATSAAKGSGDNTYIFIPQLNKYSYVRGTIPIDEDHFTISGSMPQPAKQLALTLEASLKKQSVESVSMSYPEVPIRFDSTVIFYTNIGL